MTFVPEKQSRGLSGSFPRVFPILHYIFTMNQMRSKVFLFHKYVAPRPPLEDVYDHLEEFFPNHDLDKPVIEASSGETSPTAVEHTAIPQAPVNTPDEAGVR